MFRLARLKLTGWYILMIMFVSLFFSVVIYANVDRELTRLSKIQEISRQRAEEYFGYAPPSRVTTIIEDQFIDEARVSLLKDLAILNGCIFLAAAWVGYFLAGQTLNPIKNMLDLQSRFLADASHELKTPLTTLRTEIEIFLLSKKKTLASSQKILKSNLEEVIRLQLLTDSLMELTYLENVQKKIIFEKINISKLIDEVSKSLQNQARINSIEIVQKTKKGYILAHQKSIKELLVILIDNAIKYSQPKSKVIVTNSVKKDYIQIRVKDQGIGIPKDEQDKIFERFYRSDKSRSSTHTKGYGLGLSIAKEIVRHHSGSISVDSSKKGSTFIVDLPKK